MVPPQFGAFEAEKAKDGENRERNHLLQHFELNEREWAAIAIKPDAIGRHLKAIFKQGQSPRKQNDGIERPIGAVARELQLQMAIPCKSHEYVRHDEQRHRD